NQLAYRSIQLSRVEHRSEQRPRRFLATGRYHLKEIEMVEEPVDGVFRVSNLLLSILLQHLVVAFHLQHSVKHLIDGVLALLPVLVAAR
ncbi:hypothetical protein PFISCL1PPCAC_266, partial [Pristionchus fissidentatus]